MKKRSQFRRRGVILLLLLMTIGSFHAGGQNLLTFDTLRIDEVTVKGESTRVISGFNVTTIDLNSGLNSANPDLVTLLQNNSSIYIKSYGPGSLSTISFRGTGSAHTTISWEGVPLSSPMSGMTDLTLIQPEASGKINLYMGAASLPMVSGAIGGLLDIVGDPGWGEKFSLGTSATGASFGGRSLSGRIGIGNSNWRFITRLYTTASDNNFPFESKDINGDVETLKRAGSRFTSGGISSEIHYKKNNSTGSVRVWHQTASRGIAPPLYSLATAGTESQDDSFTRLLLTYKYFPSWGSVVTSAALFNDNLEYRNTLYGYSSTGKINNYHFRTAIRRDISERTKLSLSITEEYNSVESNNFSEIKTQNNLGVALSAESMFSDKFAGHLLIRENLLGSQFLAPGMVAGVTFNPDGLNRNVFKFSGSVNSRPPSMNDLYWSPGGNPDLRIERSRSLELFFGKALTYGKENSLRFEYSAYLTSVTDLIMWVPGSDGFWLPENFGKVMIAGNDAKMLLDLRIGKMLLFSSVNYTYNLSKDLTYEADNSFFSAPQVIYNPVHTMSNNLQVSKNGYSLGLFTEYTGKRFTSTDNSEFIDPYITVDLYGSWSFGKESSRFVFTGRIANLFNSRYNLIQSYPMPGRSFQAGLKYNFKK